MKDKSNKKKESRKKNIFKKCFKRMKGIRKDKKMRKKIKDFLTFKLNKNTLKCSKNKS